MFQGDDRVLLKKKRFYDRLYALDEPEDETRDPCLLASMAALERDAEVELSTPRHPASYEKKIRMLRTVSAPVPSHSGKRPSSPPAQSQRTVLARTRSTEVRSTIVPATKTIGHPTVVTDPVTETRTIPKKLFEGLHFCG